MLPVAILAGGLATRLRPLTEKIPKSLIELNGAPFIVHQLRLLHSRGVTRVVICAGYLGEMIEQVVGDGAHWGVRADFSFDGEPLRGTAGALQRALPLLGDAFFVLYGDSYLPCDYRAAQSAFEQAGKLALMTVFRNASQWDRSNVEFANGRILVYDKRTATPAMRHIDYGLGVLHAAAFAQVPRDHPYDLATLYQNLLARDQLAGHEVAERFYEIGSFEGLEETRQYLAQQGNTP